MQNKKIVISSILFLLFCFLGAIALFKQNEAKSLEKLTVKKNSEPFIRAHSPSFGEGKKGIVIVEFLDPECEACKYFYPAVKEVYKNYYEEIKIVVRYLANHKTSADTIRILEASRKQNKYKDVLDLIFKYQSKTSSNEIWTLLKEIDSLDVDKLKKDAQSIDISDILKLDRQDAKTLKVRGTPTFFIDGEPLEKLNLQLFIDTVESKIYN